MEFLVCVLFIISLFLLNVVTAQTQRPFTCTLPAYCTSGSNTIDPRILTPGQAGSFPAQQQQVFPSAQQQAFSGQQQQFPGQNVNIVTPTTSLTTCPAGYIQCPNANVVCGRPAVPINTADGFANEGSFPWQAFLRNNNNLGVNNGYAGGGVLLNQYHVLTAAHRISNLTSISVAMGVYQFNNMAGTQISQVAAAYIHSFFNITTLRNDIAILRLATPVNIGGNIAPICLPANGQSFAAGTSCIVSGWGQTNFTTFDAPTQTLKQVHLPIVAYPTCRASFLQSTLLGTNTDIYLDSTGEICAGGGTFQDACTQDGGSPLVCPLATGAYSLAGLVIWGKNCGMVNVYGVYVSVPAYLSWITCTMQCIQGPVLCSNCPATRLL